MLASNLCKIARCFLSATVLVGAGVHAWIYFSFSCSARVLSARVSALLFLLSWIVQLTAR